MSIAAVAERDTTMPDPYRPQAFRVREAAQILGLSISMVWKMIQAGEIHVVRLGRTTRVTAAEIDRLLQRSA